MYQYQQPFGQQPFGFSPQPIMQPYQPRSGVPGRMVSSVDEITPNEVPMDGSVALFPLTDGSAILARSWNRDGTISTIMYAPTQTQESEETTVAVTLDDVMQELDDIRSLLEKPKKTTKKVSEDAGDQS